MLKILVLLLGFNGVAQAISLAPNDVATDCGVPICSILSGAPTLCTNPSSSIAAVQYEPVNYKIRRYEASGYAAQGVINIAGDTYYRIQSSNIVNSTIRNACQSDLVNSGNVNDAINACKNKLTTNDCGSHVTNRLCSGTNTNGYFISTVANSMGGADVLIKGLGDKELLPFTANPNGVDIYELGLPNCQEEPNFTNAISSCKNTISQLNNSCPATGSGWASCSNSDYKYKINSWDINNGSGGAINIKIPSGATQSVTRTQMGANACLSLSQYKANAISACSGIVTSCPTSDFVYSQTACNSGQLGFTLLQQNAADYYVSRKGFVPELNIGGQLSLYFKLKGTWGSPRLLSSISATAINATQCVPETPETPDDELIKNPEDIGSVVEQSNPTGAHTF